MGGLVGLMNLADKYGVAKDIQAYVNDPRTARFVMQTLKAKAPEIADKLTIDNLHAGYINATASIPEASSKQEVIAVESIDELMAESAKTEERIAQADPNPSRAQMEAGNAKKGKFRWNGLTISVETAKGEEQVDKETMGQKSRNEKRGRSPVPR